MVTLVTNDMLNAYYRLYPGLKHCPVRFHYRLPTIIIVSRMLASGSDPLKRDIDGLTPSHFAAIAGNVETFGELPKACHTMVDSVGCRMPIHYAAICGKMAIMDMLISYAS